MTCARSRRASPFPSSTILTTCSPSSTPSRTSRRWCGSTETTASSGPTAEAFGTDTFADFTGAESAPHLDLVRRLGPPRRGCPSDADAASGAVADLSDEEVRARLHFRIAAEAHRRGDAGHDPSPRPAGAANSPPTTSRCGGRGCRSSGEDPFGQGFLDRFEAVAGQGQPGPRARRRRHPGGRRRRSRGRLATGGAGQAPDELEDGDVLLGVHLHEPDQERPQGDVLQLLEHPDQTAQLAGVRVLPVQ